MLGDPISTGDASGGLVLRSGQVPAGGGLPFSTNAGDRYQPGRSPNLPLELLGRWGPTERFNRLSVTFHATARLGWDEINVDRPTILFPVQQLAGRVHYRPHDLPQTDVQGDAYFGALQAAGPGVVYLWAPGKWWVKYHAAAGDAEFLQIACEDAVMASQLLATPGFQSITRGAFVTNATPNTSETLLAANNYRRGLIVTAGAVGTYAVCLGGTANCGVGTMNGLILGGLGASLSLFGPSVWKGAVTVATNNPSRDVTYVEFV